MTKKNSNTKKKHISKELPKYVSPSEKRVEQLQAEVNELQTKLTLMQTKLLLAKTMEAQGANPASIAEKLNVSVDRIESLLLPGVDIEMRDLSNFLFAMGKQCRFDMKPKEKNLEMAFENTVEIAETQLRESEEEYQSLNH